MAGLDHIRIAQVQELYRYFPTAGEIREYPQCPGVYDINFPAMGKYFVLRLTLPPQFPQAPPQMQLFPQTTAIPNLMDAEGRVFHPNLKQWPVVTSLGAFSRDIVGKLQSALNNPAANATANPATGFSPAIVPNAYNTNPAVANTAVGSRQSVSFPTPGLGKPVAAVAEVKVTLPVVPKLPDVPATIPELASLSEVELEGLLADDAKFLAFYQDLSYVKELTKVEDDLKRKVQSLAEENLSKDAVIAEQKRQLAEQFALLAEARREFDLQSAQQQELQKKFQPPAVRAALITLHAQAEAEAEAVLNRFKAREIDADQMAKEYVEKKKIAHQRRIKLELLQKIVK